MPYTYISRSLHPIIPLLFIFACVTGTTVTCIGDVVLTCHTIASPVPFTGTPVQL
jgi:cytochrome b subunit of formate dehydrogenase